MAGSRRSVLFAAVLAMGALVACKAEQERRCSCGSPMTGDTRTTEKTEKTKNAHVSMHVRVSYSTYKEPDYCY